MASALVDTGAFVAWFDRSDAHHRRARAFFTSFEGSLVTTWPVLTETCHLLPPTVAIKFMRFMAEGHVGVIELPAHAVGEVTRLMAKYLDRPMDLADASLVWAAEEAETTAVASVDRHDFATYRTKSGKPFLNLFFPADHP